MPLEYWTVEPHAGRMRDHINGEPVMDRPWTLERIKKEAKRLKKLDGVQHALALEIIAERAGFIDYKDAVERLRE